MSPILVWKHHNIITIFEELCVSTFNEFILYCGCQLVLPNLVSKFMGIKDLNSTYPNLTYTFFLPTHSK